MELQLSVRATVSTVAYFKLISDASLVFLYYNIFGDVNTDWRRISTTPLSSTIENQRNKLNSA